jgi:hypothetical protein
VVPRSRPAPEPGPVYPGTRREHRRARSWCPTARQCRRRAGSMCVCGKSARFGEPTSSSPSASNLMLTADAAPRSSPESPEPPDCASTCRLASDVPRPNSRRSRKEGSNGGHCSHSSSSAARTSWWLYTSTVSASAAEHHSAYAAGPPGSATPRSWGNRCPATPGQPLRRAPQVDVMIGSADDRTQTDPPDQLVQQFGSVLGQPLVKQFNLGRRACRHCRTIWVLWVRKRSRRTHQAARTWRRSSQAPHHTSGGVLARSDDRRHGH